VLGSKKNGLRGKKGGRKKESTIDQDPDALTKETIAHEEGNCWGGSSRGIHQIPREKIRPCEGQAVRKRIKHLHSGRLIKNVTPFSNLYEREKACPVSKHEIVQGTH